MSLSMTFPAEQKIIALVVLLGVLVGGCSANNRPIIQDVSTHNAPPAYKILDNTYWWRCKFKNVWPANTRPDFVIDLFLAHAVVSPVLGAHIDDIPYWRFHRRAARDQTGHQFSLLFYSKPEVASAIFKEIQGSEMLEKAIAAKLVEKVITDNPDTPDSSDIASTSDPRWSVDLQKNWPSFIMGVSSLWLGLIDDSFAGSPKDFADMHQLLDRYREVDYEITGIWRSEGQHAFLHHMNAVFGYQPLIISKELSF